MITYKALHNWSQAKPGFVILLTDRSETESLYCNKIINNLILMNFCGDRVRNRCFIMVLDCNNGEEICSNWLSDLCNNPVKIETTIKTISDGAGGFLTIPLTCPLWVIPSFQTYETNEHVVLSKVNKYIQEWISEHNNISEVYQSSSPLIIDIGCHYSTISNNDYNEIKANAFCFGFAIDDSCVLSSSSYDALTTSDICRNGFADNSLFVQRGIFHKDELCDVLYNIAKTGNEPGINYR